MYNRQHPELLLKPIVISRTEEESVMIEGSINSLRMSVRIRKSDELDKILANRFLRFLSQRAEEFVILRRKPIEGYDISFLVTNFHTEDMFKHKLVDFIIQFLNDIDSEISAMKTSLNGRARVVATEFLMQFRS
eukprot:TRINITY_DN689_c0_g1_i1.p1 TRINITY_DN689_c0_g1~~TRINITY_DN689_c0_g1_i1.p1  ORF type:complete len:134 (-),score=23.48 TRINITY_DN689_c0_g1_i1:52-453(-)